MTATEYDNPDQILFTGSGIPGDPTGSGTNRYVFSNTQMFGSGDPNRTTFADDGNSTLGAYAPVCYASGTLISTVRGDVAVEDLRIGDLAVTSSGEHRPIRWLGHQTIKTRGRRDPAVMPIRIMAGALGESRPVRDLLVSPGHAICLDVLGEVLIPASALVNGTTIVQDDVESVTYWHVELDSHDILIADGQPAESYLDMGSRGFFKESADINLGAVPDADAAARTHADFCRPFHAEGAFVEVAIAQIAARAKLAGWRLEDASWGDIHLLVDGERVEPDMHGSVARFPVSEKAGEIWLVSNTSVPSNIGESGDRRTLGLCLQSIAVDDAESTKRMIALNDPRLSEGFHDVEEGVRRWTNGRAKLPASLLEGYQGRVFLRIELAGPALPRWAAPERTDAELGLQLLIMAA